jgi:hypothetical protein
MARIDPVVPPAPEKFSMTNRCPIVRDMCSPTMRAAKSVPPPGGNGTIIETGRVGYDCAQASRVIAGNAVAPAARCRNLRRGSRMTFPLTMTPSTKATSARWWGGRLIVVQCDRADCPCGIFGTSP